MPIPISGYYDPRYIRSTESDTPLKKLRNIKIKYDRRRAQRRMEDEIRELREEYYRNNPSMIDPNTLPKLSRNSKFDGSVLRFVPNRVPPSAPSYTLADAMTDAMTKTDDLARSVRRSMRLQNKSLKKMSQSRRISRSRRSYRQKSSKKSRRRR